MEGGDSIVVSNTGPEHRSDYQDPRSTKPLAGLWGLPSVHDRRRIAPGRGDAPLGRAVGDAARYFMTMIDWTAVLVANPSIMAALHTDYEAVMACLGAPLAATAMRNLPPPELAGAGFRCVHRNSPSGLGAGQRQHGLVHGLAGAA
jgi:hypothetical protein